MRASDWLVVALLPLLAACSSGGSGGGCSPDAGELTCGTGACCPATTPYYCPGNFKCYGGTLQSANAQCPGNTYFNGQPDNIIMCQ